MKFSAYILLFAICLLGCRENIVDISIKEHTFERVPINTHFAAGDVIQIQYKTEAETNTFVIIKNAFGSSVLQPMHKENVATFILPNEFTHRSGLCHWTLVHNNIMQDKGVIRIHPNPKKGTAIESYLGPRSISAGKTFFSMFVVSPTDTYDNPLDNRTEIDYTYQFENNIQSIPVTLNNLIGWKNIQSTEKSGRMLVTASCNDAKSKELTTKIYPAHATNFKINYSRNHQWADGNQVIQFTTDIIQDEFGNVISDGTLVSFAIINNAGMLLQTMGTTINGVAKADLLHPNKEENWEITAYITGAAKSDTITVSFEAAIKNYNITLSQNNRNVKIDGIRSFMGQWVPDGIPIIVEIRDPQGILLDSKRTTSRLGKAEFALSADFYPNGNYQLYFEIAGLIKTKNVIFQ